jgi:hypothetical protein
MTRRDLSVQVTYGMSLNFAVSYWSQLNAKHTGVLVLQMKLLLTLRARIAGRSTAGSSNSFGLSSSFIPTTERSSRVASRKVYDIQEMRPRCQ